MNNDRLDNIQRNQEKMKAPASALEAVDRGVKRYRTQRRFMGLKRTGLVAAAVIFGFGASVNLSTTFASNISKLPLLGDLAKIMTIEEYSITKDNSNVSIKVPNIINVNNKVVENYINKIIDEKIESITKNLGVEKDVTIDYTFMYSDTNVVSFIINKKVDGAVMDRYYFNINLKTGYPINLNNTKKDDATNYYIDKQGNIKLVDGDREELIGNISEVYIPEEMTIIGEEIFSANAAYVDSTSNEITLNIAGKNLKLDSMMKYDYKPGTDLRVKYVLEDSGRYVLLQCYPEANNIHLEVVDLAIGEDQSIIVTAKSDGDNKLSFTIAKGVKVVAEKEDISIGDRVKVYYDTITDDEPQVIYPYEVIID